MKPLTQALDVFQNEENMSVRCVLPVLSLLKEKIIEFKEDRNIIHCAAFVTSLLNGIEKRFRSFHENNSFRLASISDPHFKFSWVTEEQKIEDIKLLKQEVNRRISNLANESIEGDDATTAHLSGTSSSPRKRSRFLDGLQRKASIELNEVDRYINDGCGVLEDLNRYPTIKQIFIEYNSALPSSTACERLFSTAGWIFVPKRTNLSDAKFDRLVFLKQNGKSSRNWKTSPSKTN
ncbi:uncharacterized protein LOC116927638 [Daphnia magna]|uniref:uncharacterized protein LOC116927638 n=1 Tax=Daphnia magna TaxID=35525 RepID=UPI001E1BC187|nr:uncharacterized protein LOC116927638 [Daphnia magna]